jgi:hypothetical protein
MTDTITITLPAINDEAIQRLEQQQTETFATEQSALEAMLKTYGRYAKHAGYVKVASYESEGKSDAVYLQSGGKKVRGLLADDNFVRERTHHNDTRGVLSGDRLYLTGSGWVRIVREGSWSQWQGEPDVWRCGNVPFADETGDDYDEPPNQGRIVHLDSAEVASQYKLSEICQQLAKSLEKLNEAIPERYAKLRQQAELAGQILSALQTKEGAA